MIKYIIGFLLGATIITLITMAKETEERINIIELDEEHKKELLKIINKTLEKEIAEGNKEKTK